MSARRPPWASLAPAPGQLAPHDRLPTEEEIEAALAWNCDNGPDFWPLMGRWQRAAMGSPALIAALEPIDKRRAETLATIERLVAALKVASDREERGVPQAERDEARRERDEAREVLRLFVAYAHASTAFDQLFGRFGREHPIWAMVDAVVGPVVEPSAGPVSAFINPRNRKSLAELEAAAALPPIARAGRAVRWG